MNDTLKKQLVRAAPILYKIAGKSPEWKIEASNDLFPFLQELSLEIEKFNRRYRKRAVMVMKIAMTGGELVFLLHRQIPALEKKDHYHTAKDPDIQARTARGIADKSEKHGNYGAFCFEADPGLEADHAG